MSNNAFIHADAIEGNTRVFATEQDEYEDLLVRDETLSDGTNCMVTKWTPSREALAILNGGGSLYLGIMGDGEHPPTVMKAALLDEYEKS